MTTANANFTRRRPAKTSPNTPIPEFHAPPLRPIFVDIARDLAAIRQRRALLTQRLGAAWVRSGAHAAGRS